MKQAEVNELSTKDLAERIVEEKASLTKTKMGHKVSPVENPLKIRDARRTIARMKTELKKRQIAAAKK